MSNTSLLGSYGDNSGSALMFRNRLINASSFDIWQRGTSFSSLAAYTYTADRWLTDGAVTTVARTGSQNNIMQVVTQAGTGIAQRMETFGGGFFAGQTYTISGLVNCSVANLTVTVTYRDGNTFKSTIHTANVSSQLTANQYSYFTTSFTLANAPTDFAGTNCIQVSFTSSVVNTINFQSAQFESGPTATPFERRPIGTELALAQRYCYQMNFSGATATNLICVGTSASGGRGNVRVLFPVTMRGNPVYTSVPGATGFLPANDTVFTAFTNTSSASTTVNGASITMTGAGSGFLNGVAAVLETNTTNYMRFDAEL